MSTIQKLQDEIGRIQKALHDRNQTIDNQRGEIVDLTKENEKLKQEIKDLKTPPSVAPK